MSAKADELEIANQEGYDEGRIVGFNEGIEHAARLMLGKAGFYFENDSDQLATRTREHSKLIRTALRSIDEKGQ